MFDNLFIAIPSYKRAHEQLTLDYLERVGFPKEMIIMSVQTEEDFQLYKEAGIDKRVGKLLYRPGDCISDNRNALLDFLNVGDYVIMLDDDIKAILSLQNDKLVLIEYFGMLMNLFLRGFAEASKAGTVGFGLYPTDNAYFMSDTVATRTIVDGMFFGLINTRLRFDPRFKVKEDYEFCCRAIEKYGAFVRLNNFATRAKSHSKGGCEEAWADKQGRIDEANFLVSKYPELLIINTRRTTGEVLMRRQKK